MKRKFVSEMESSYPLVRGPSSCCLFMQPAMHGTKRRGLSCSSIKKNDFIKLQTPHIMPSGRLCIDITRNPYKCPVPNYDPLKLRHRKSLGLKRGAGQGESTIARGKEEPTASDQDAPDRLYLFVPNSEQFEGSSALVSVEVDQFLAEKLRPHQRDGVKFIFGCLGVGHAGADGETHHGCILSDGMGMGKSCQAIVVLWALLTGGIYGRSTCKRPLILCPSSLVQNWGKELEHWIGSLRLHQHLVTETTPAAVQNTLLNFRSSPASRPCALVMSYNTFRLHKLDVYGCGIDVVVCDEAHFLKNGDSQTTQAVKGLQQTIPKRRLLLTGTPIQNDLLELFTLMDLANPGLLGTSPHFCKYFEGPILAGRDSNSNTAIQTLGRERKEELTSICQNVMIRRTSELLKQYLPPKCEQTVFCRMSPLQQDLYNHFCNSGPVQVATGQRHGSKDARKVAVLPAIAALKKLCCHPALVYPLAHRQQLEQGLTGFEGANTLFASCRTYPAYVHGKCQAQHSGKVMVLEQLLKAIRRTCPTDKVVLVSNYTEALDVLAQMCHTNGWETFRLDGSCALKHRQPIIDRFNDPGNAVFVLLLSSKAGGVGLNIVGANRLMLFDPDWNPANDAQALARVWREGQKKQVFIYRFLTTGSIEEKIYQRQLLKNGISKEIIDDAEEDTHKLSQTTLKNLFQLNPLSDGCDTHNMIKCPCLGDPNDRTFKDSSSGHNNLEIMIHLRHARDSYDPTWAHVSDWLCSKYITFLFCDHRQEPAVDHLHCNN
eukprot:jgi/Botrbrau1/23506/Bobra.106_1s0057.1